MPTAVAQLGLNLEGAALTLDVDERLGHFGLTQGTRAVAAGRPEAIDTRIAPEGEPRTRLAPLPEGVRVPVRTDSDIVLVRKLARDIAARLGFSGTDRTLLATAVSELAHNIVQYAEAGTIELRPFERRGLRGILLVAADKGPGIADVGLALQDGFSTSGRMGVGLPGVKRLMDEFEIRSAPRCGTTIRTTKCLPGMTILCRGAELSSIDV